MLKFSDRYGYTSPRKSLIVEELPTVVANAICSILDALRQKTKEIALGERSYYTDNLTYGMIEKEVWVKYLGKYSGDLKFYYGECDPISVPYFRNTTIQWYEKLNLLEFIINYLYDYAQIHNDYYRLVESFVSRINNEFERLFFGYRIIDGIITPIADKIEIETIEETISGNSDNVKLHIEAALAHYSKRPEPDYRNSIKESISAVECVCREITGESTLDRAIPKLQAKGIQLNPQFEDGLKKMYYYTNDQRTGIRHALLDDAYVPTIAEAKYMLVVCAAFVNYIRMLTI